MMPDHTERDSRRIHLSRVVKIALIIVGLVTAFAVLALAAVPALVGLVTIASREGTAPTPSTQWATPAPQLTATVPPSNAPIPFPATPSAVSTPTTAPPTPEAGGIPAAVESVRLALIGQLRVKDQSEVRVVSWEHVDWPNGCLGIPIRDTMCTEAIVPGYRVVLEIKGGLRYEYRTNRDGSLILLAAAPPTGIERPALAWEGNERGGGFCRILTLAPNGEALVGPCGAPQAPLRLFDDMNRPKQLEYLLDRFAPFKADTPAGKIDFHGRGQEVAAPVWQRAIAEWSRLVQQELRSGRSGASWGLALAWQSPTGTDGRCQNLQVEVYGLAYASASRCEGGETQDLGHAWLSTDDLVRLYGWLDRFAPLERQTTSRLVVSGTGTQRANEADADAIDAWAQSQFQSQTSFRPSVTEAQAIESAKGIDATASWQAKFVPDLERDVKGRSEKHPTWVVEAVYPSGNRVVAFIDARTGEVSHVAQVEPPEDGPAQSLKYFWPTKMPHGLVAQPDQSSANDTAFALQLAEPDGGQFRATIVGGRDSRASDRAYGVGGKSVTVRGQQAMAYTTGAGYSVYWTEDGQPYAIISGLGLTEALALAEGLEPLDLSAWRQQVEKAR